MQQTLAKATLSLHDKRGGDTLNRIERLGQTCDNATTIKDPGSSL